MKFIRENPEVVEEAAGNKGVEVDVKELLVLDEERRRIRGTLDDLQRRRKELARHVAGSPRTDVVEEGRRIKQQLQEMEERYRDYDERLTGIVEALPNIPTADTPVGKDESGNVVLREVGEKRAFDFVPKGHWELGAALGVIDSEAAAAVVGSRFTYLKGGLVWLQFALVQHALSVLTDEEQLAAIAKGVGLSVPTTPFVPVIPPVMIRPEVMHKMARLEPREERYHIPSDDLYLVGSAEHTLGPLHMDEVLDEDMLPRRYVGYSTSFRREAGSYGKDVKGILRLHQFDKLEIESFTLPEHSLAEQDFIVAIQEFLMQSLEVPYQVVLKCTGDMGTPNARAIDIETWLPGQEGYRETHTSDLMTDYQARRLRARVKRADGSKEFVHMNDATVFAIGRMLIAVMENYQQADGAIAVPEVLQKYVPFEKLSG